MAFNFSGTPGSAPAPAGPAPATGGFSFGSPPAAAAAPTPAFGAPAAAPFGVPAPTTGFGSTAPATGGFGSTTPAFGTPAPAGALGSAAPPATTAPAFGAAPSPTTGAFGAPATGAFGSTPVTGGFGTPAPTAGLFGSTGAPTPAPGLSFGSTAGPAPVAAKPVLTVGTYDSFFPFRKIYDQVTKLLSQLGSEDSELVCKQLQRTVIDNPAIAQLMVGLDGNSVANPVPPNQGLRTQLQQTPLVTLSLEQPDGTVKEQEAGLGSKMLQEIFALSDDLGISEAQAICLFHRAKTSPNKHYRAEFVQKCLKGRQMPNTFGRSAREMYFEERRLLLQAILVLLQYRQQEEELRVGLGPFFARGWIPNMIKLVVWYTGRLQTLSHSQKDTSFWRQEVMVQACYEERQLAADCIFFAAYSTQLTVPEVVALIDLVRDLSNQLRLLDPIEDVPDPFENSEDWMNRQAPEKDPLKWERQLAEGAWQTGLPQLLKCCSTLVVTVVGALGHRAELFNRDTLDVNAFRVGNALLPPGSESADGLAQIQNKLMDVNSWGRQDVLGIFMAAYGVLLRTCPAAVTSPRGGGAPSLIRKACRECMQAPAKFRSFSFARLALLPALRKWESASHGEWYMTSFATPCDSSEFLLSVFCEFTSQYLDEAFKSGERPISRAKWFEDAQEDLNLRRESKQETERFRGQFFYNAGSAEAAQEVPTSVDEGARPDCMDDMIALAASLCCLGPHYSLQFWEPFVSRTDSAALDAAIFQPSRALLDLADMQVDDDSLRPTFLSFLSSLSTASTVSQDGSIKYAAPVIHNFLSTETGIGARTWMSWTTVFDSLRWYSEQLSPNGYGGSSRFATSTTDSNRNYYYALSAGKQNSVFGNSNTDTSPRELGEDNTIATNSYLALISNVAMRSSEAKNHILSLTLSPSNRRGPNAATQNAITILFELLVMPLSPFVRGKIFQTIADLLDLGSSDKDRTRECALEAWELLEQCQIIPTRLLQSQGVPNEMPGGEIGMAFPPSSFGLVTKKSGQFLDSKYGILYEMEFIESAIGRYPSTCGFLCLLATLVQSGGCPSDLGHKWRSRPGCNPYVEYALNFVLKHAVDIEDDCFPFVSALERYKLMTASTDFLLAVLAPYVIPTKPDALKKGNYQEIWKMNKEDAFAQLKQAAIVSKVVRETHEDAVDDFASDFAPKDQTTLATPSRNSSYQGMFPPKKPTSASAEKSSAFALLVSILTNGVCNQLDTLLKALSGATVDSSDLPDEYVHLTVSLYVRTPPSFTSAKDRRQSPASHSIAEGLDYAVEISEIEWRKKSAAGVLQLLCAAVAREGRLCALSTTLPSKLDYSPSIRFDARSIIPNGEEVKFSNLWELVNVSKFGRQVLDSTTKLIGIATSDYTGDIDLAGFAASLFLYIERSLRPNQMTEALLSSRFGVQTLTNALSRRFTRLGYQDTDEISLLRQLMGHIVKDLEQNRSSSLSVAAFGPKLNPSQLGCLEALMDFPLRLDCDPSNAPLIAECYEALYLSTCAATNSGDMPRSVAVTKRLHAVGFWRQHLITVTRQMSLANTECTDYEWWTHSAAWIIKGLSNEIMLLAGAFGNAGQLTEYKELCESLFHESGMIARVLVELPLEHAPFSSQFPGQVSLLANANVDLEGPPSVTRGYKSVRLERILSVCGDENENSIDTMKHWVESWNHYVGLDCAASHGSNAIRTAICALLATRERLGLLDRADGPRLSALLQQVLSSLRPSTESLVTFARASHDLSWAALSLFDGIVNLTDVVPGTLGSIENLLGTLFDAIFYASKEGVAEPEAAFHQRKVLLLACLLTSMLDFEDFRNVVEKADTSDLILMASSIAPLAYVSIAPENRSEVIAARTAFGRLVALGGERILDFASPYSLERPLQQCVQLISALDPDVGILLNSVASTDHGCEVLVEQGIVEALVSAAGKYTHSRHVSPQEAPPGHLRSHMDLLSTLVGANVPSKAKVARVATDIIVSYEGYIRNLIGNYPANRRDLLSIVRCIALTKLRKKAQDSLALPWQASTTNPVHSDDVDLLPHIREGILGLCFGISCNLLPFTLQSTHSYLNPNSSGDPRFWEKTLTGLTEYTVQRNGLPVVAYTAISDNFELLRFGLCATRDAMSPEKAANLLAMLENTVDVTRFVLNLVQSTTQSNEKGAATAGQLRSLLSTAFFVVIECLIWIRCCPTESQTVQRSLDRCRLEEIASDLSRVHAVDENALPRLQDHVKAILNNHASSQ